MKEKKIELPPCTYNDIALISNAMAPMRHLNGRKITVWFMIRCNTGNYKSLSVWQKSINGKKHDHLEPIVRPTDEHLSRRSLLK